MAISLVQSATHTINGVSSQSVLFTSVVSSGNSIVVICGQFHAAAAGGFSTVTDNVNNAGYTQRIFSTMVSDTSAHLLYHDKLNISSGAGASTYRVSINMVSGANGMSACAMEFSGGPLVFGSTGSSNGTSTGPRGPAQTASSTPPLFVSGAVVNSTAQFASTMTGGTWLATVDTGNVAQITNIGYSTNSSLTQQLMHSMTASTRWLAGTVMYTGLGSGGGAGVVNPWRMALLGVQ